jgi:hypothetical protein
MRGLAPRFFMAALVVGAGLGARTVYNARRNRAFAVSSARKGLDEYVVLEQTYKASQGRYADSVFSLAGVSVDPKGVLANAAVLYDQGRVDVTGDKDHFTLSAHATDPGKTAVSVSGP